MKHSLQDDLRDKRIREKAALDRKVENMEGQKAWEDDENRTPEELAVSQERKRLVREMSLDSERLYPNEHQRVWLQAQSYLSSELYDSVLDQLNEELDPVMLKEFEGKGEPLEGDGTKFLNPDNTQMAKHAYKNVMGRLTEINKREEDFVGSNFLEDFLAEKALDLSRFTGDLEHANVETKVGRELKKRADMTRKEQMDPVETFDEKHIRKQIDNLMARVDPSITAVKLPESDLHPERKTTRGKLAKNRSVNPKKQQKQKK